MAKTNNMVDGFLAKLQQKKITDSATYIKKNEDKEAAYKVFQKAKEGYDNAMHAAFVAECELGKTGSAIDALEGLPA